MNKEHYAQLLRDSSNSKKAIEPLRNEIGVTDLELAYSIQNINTQLRLDNGARIMGKKVGLTSFSVQKQLGVDQPDFGILFDDMEILNGQFVSMKDLMQPKIEGEIAFVLAEDLDSEQLTILDVIGAIDYALPSLEIVGSRIRDWDIKITDTIADNASASHYVLGHTPKTLDEFDVVNCTMSLTKNGKEVSSGVGSACIGSPLNAVLWLANKMIEVGQPLQTGEVILSGALGPMSDIKEGDQIEVLISGLGSASVGVTI